MTLKNFQRYQDSRSERTPCSEQISKLLKDILTTTTHSSTYSNKDVVMFNIRDDPYELHNIFDENSALGGEMVDEIKAIAKNIRQNLGTVSVNSDTSVATHPDNTGQTTAGWCDPSLMVPTV